MNIGMLWFDNDSTATLSLKIERAVAYYKDKYGKVATLCFVHPCMLVKGDALPAGINVQASKSVLPNHFWIGVSNERTVELSSV